MYGLPYKVETNTKTYRLKHKCTQKFVLPLSPSSQARIQITWILCMNHMLIPWRSLHFSVAKMWRPSWVWSELASWPKHSLQFNLGELTLPSLTSYPKYLGFQKPRYFHVSLRDIFIHAHYRLWSVKNNLTYWLPFLYLMSLYKSSILYHREPI